jgi:hypothetical protein
VLYVNNRGPEAHPFYEQDEGAISVAHAFVVVCYHASTHAEIADRAVKCAAREVAV